MTERIDREALEQEKADIQNLVSELEDNYRKAEISEKNYEELSRKYADRIAEIDAALGMFPDKRKQPEEKTITKDDSEKLSDEVEEAEEPEEENEAKKDQTQSKKGTDSKGEKKGGLFSRLIGKKGADGDKGDKKEEKKDQKSSDEPPEVDLGGLDPSSPEAIEKLAAAAAANAGVDTSESKEEEAPTGDSGVPKDIEIEKLKLMLEAVREEQKSTDESIRNLAESIGEIRSMVFTEDSSLKEEGARMERIETEIGEVKPKEIENKFRDFRAKMEQTDLAIEKLETKSTDLAERVNKVYDMMKKIGGVENLITIDKDIQQKIDDIKEALKYTERLALKTEKMFIDVNRALQDMVVYKTRQEGLDESVKDLIKNIDAINARLNDVITRKDLDTTRQDILLLHNHLEEIQKVLPLLETKMPETIAALREERGNIQLFLESLADHYKSRTITSVEYEEAKRKNMAKLAKIEEQLRDEWKKVEGMVASGVLPKDQTTTSDGENGSEAQPTAPAPQPEARPSEPQSGASGTREAEEKTEAKEEAEEEKPKKPKRTRKKKEPIPEPVASPETEKETKKSGTSSPEENPDDVSQPAKPKTVEPVPAEDPSNTPLPEKNVEERSSPAPSNTSLPAPKDHTVPIKSALPKQVQQAPDTEVELDEDTQRKAVENFVESAVSRLGSRPAVPITTSPSNQSETSESGPDKGSMEDVIKKVREKMR